MKPQWERHIPVITGVVTFASGLFIIAPGIYWGESAIITARAWQLGGSHPSGYSGFLHLIHVFQKWLPIGNIPFRGNIASLLFLSVFAMLTARLLLTLKVPLRIVFPVTLGLCFCRPVSEASSAVEVYSLHLLLFVLITSVIHSEIHLNKRLYLAAFLASLMLTHHLTSVLFVPGLVLWILVEHRNRVQRSFFLPVVLLVIAGFSSYLYLPVRDALIPGLVWGNPRTWQGFFRLVTASEEARGAFVSGFSDFPAVAGRGGALFDLIRTMLTLPGILITVFGVYAFHRRFRGISLFFCVSMVMLTIPVMIYDSHESASFYLPGFLVIWIWFASGLHFIADRISQKFQKYNLLFSGLSVSAAVCVMILNLTQSYDQRASDVHVPASLVRLSLDSAGENGLIISRRSDWCFLHWYFVQIERRADVSTVYQPLLSFHWYYENLVERGLMNPGMPVEYFEDSWSWNSAITASLAIQNLGHRPVRFADVETLSDAVSAGIQIPEPHCSVSGMELWTNPMFQKRFSVEGLIIPGRLDPASTQALGYLYYQLARCLHGQGKDRDAAEAVDQANRYRRHGLLKGWWD